MSRTLMALAAAAALAPGLATAGAYLGVGVGGTRVESTLGELGILPGIESDRTGLDGIGADPDFGSSQVGLQVIAGWMFTPNIGVEVGYVDFGTAEQFYDLPKSPLRDDPNVPNVPDGPDNPDRCEVFDSNQIPTDRGCQDRQWTAEDETSGFQAFLVGSYTINESFDLYGKLGGIYWESESRGFERSQGVTNGGPPLGPQNTPVSADDDGFDLATGFGVNLKTDSPFSVRADFTYYAIQNTDTAWSLQLVAMYSFQ